MKLMFNGKCSLMQGKGGGKETAGRGKGEGRHETMTKGLFIYIMCYYIFSSEVRLQFRLPDGSSLTQNFPREALLDTARKFICSVRMSPYLIFNNNFIFVVLPCIRFCSIGIPHHSGKLVLVSFLNGTFTVNIYCFSE